MVEKTCQAGWDFFFRKKYAECCRFLQGWWNMKRLEDDQGNEQIVPFFYIFFAYLYQNCPIWFAKKKWAKSESSQEGRRNGCLQGRPQRAWRCKVDQVFEWRVLFGVCCWRFGFASFPQVFHGTVQSMDAAPKLQVQEVSTSASKLWWNSFAATFWQSFSQFFAKNQDTMYKKSSKHPSLECKLLGPAFLWRSRAVHRLSAKRWRDNLERLDRRDESEKYIEIW